MKKRFSIIQSIHIERAILLIRGHKVMLDKDLAILYAVSTRQLNKAVTRNLGRFPEDFMFQLSKKEHRNLMFHFGTSSWGGTRKLPRVFTGQGVAMLSSVLRSKRAAEMNVRIMRAFVKLREFLATNKELAGKLVELEQRLGGHDEAIRDIVAAIRNMMKTSIHKKPKGPIGVQP